jgi:hypothetical protein
MQFPEIDGHIWLRAKIDVRISSARQKTDDLEFFFYEMA